MRSRSFESLTEQYERLLARPNPADEHFYNGMSGCWPGRTRRTNIFTTGCLSGTGIRC